LKKAYILKILIIFSFGENFILFLKRKNKKNEIIDDIDVNILYHIQNKIQPFIEQSWNEEKFLNGIIRRIKPKKILEIGVSAGGSSSIILNAIKDIPKAKLYSVDRYKKWYKNNHKEVGWLVKEYFPELLDKWILFTGGNVAEYIDYIGNNIDLVYIDTIHRTPGEMINWLEVLPFLKKDAVVIFHDVFLMFIGDYSKKPNTNFSNNQLICYIRGKLILPAYGNKVFDRNIAAIKLEKNQKDYYEQYFLALGNQWHYLPNQQDFEILRKHFLKYYGKIFAEIFEEAYEKNNIRLKEKNITNNISYNEFINYNYK